LVVQPDASLERRSSLKVTITHALSIGKRASVKLSSAKLVEEEQREIGRVSSSMYKLYLTKAFGPWLITLLFIVQTGWQTLMFSDYWLAYETSSSREGSLLQAFHLGLRLIELVVWLEGFLFILK
jgi:hypothetical protein